MEKKYNIENDIIDEVILLLNKDVHVPNSCPLDKKIEFAARLFVINPESMNNDLFEYLDPDDMEELIRDFCNVKILISDLKDLQYKHADFLEKTHDIYTKAIVGIYGNMIDDIWEKAIDEYESSDCNCNTYDRKDEDQY